MHPLVGVDLLPKRRDAGVCDKGRVESVHAVPRCISCVGTGQTACQRGGLIAMGRGERRKSHASGS
jgi:hypothetical protein